MPFDIKRVNGLRGYRCNYSECDFGSNKLNIVKEHINKVHANQNPFNCVKCDASFKEKINLRIHIKGVHSETVFRCDWPQCEFETKYRANWRTHRKIHTGVKGLRCGWPACEAMFFTNSKLREHLRFFHNKERPFACVWPGCEDAFKDQNNLDTHINRVHTGHKPFKCSKCTKSYTRKGCLRVHLNIVHNKCKYKCDLCQFRTHRMLHLKAHQNLCQNSQNS